MAASLFLHVTFKQVFDIPLLNNLFISFLNLFISSIEENLLKEHRCKFKIDKPTQSDRVEQRIALA